MMGRTYNLHGPRHKNMLDLHHLNAATVVCGLFLGVMLALIFFIVTFRIAVDHMQELEGPGIV